MASRDMPEEHVLGLRALATLDESAQAALLSSLTTTMPGLLPDDLAEAYVAVGLTTSDARNASETVSDFYDAIERRGKGDVEAFLERAQEVAVENGAVDAHGWATVSNLLVKLLQLHDTVGVTSKAFGVTINHDKVYCNSQVISDIRPVFHPRRKPLFVSAAVVLHDLRLVYHTGTKGERDEVFISMDREDLEALREQINRAIEKDDALALFVSKSEVPNLNRKGRSE